MQVYRYWARADGQSPNNPDYKTAFWAGSDESEADAQRKAQHRLDHIDWRALEDYEYPRDDYTYQHKPHPEPLLDEVLDDDGTRAAAFTINRYGATVLNTRTLAFIDVDLDGEHRPTLADVRAGGMLGKLGKKKRASDDEIIDAITTLALDWSAQSAARGVRLYQTAAGVRIAIATPALEPAGEEIAALMREWQADPAYRRLCHVQQCYRARVTPKPWRMASGSRPDRIDYLTYNDGSRLEWLKAYERQREDYAVCTIVAEGGQPASGLHGDVLAMHDELCGVGSGKPLA